MVIQNQRLELLYDEAECYYYAITNCMNAQDGHSDNPGFRVTMRGLNREMWQQLRPSLELGDASIDAESLPDDVALEILYCLLGGKGCEDYRDEIGWEIMSLVLHSERSFCINIVNRQLEALNDLLANVDRQSATPGHPVSTLTRQSRVGYFWVYWSFSEPADFTTLLKMESLDEESNEKYQIVFGQRLNVVEELPHCRRELRFHPSAIKRDGQKYLPVDVVETLC